LNSFCTYNEAMYKLDLSYTQEMHTRINIRQYENKKHG
jgi:hypothetical protein